MHTVTDDLLTPLDKCFLHVLSRSVLHDAPQGQLHPALRHPELNPVENVWACLRANKPAITVFDTCDDIVEACCTAWNFFANDPKAIASITSRSWAEVS